MAHRIFITGCSGYLAQRLIAACQNDSNIEWIGGIDVRPPQNQTAIQFFGIDVRSPELAALLHSNRVDTIVHLAWIFNPTHEPQLEYEVDVLGSQNVLEAAKKAAVPYLIYLSSTTAYGPHPDNPEILDETYPRRGHSGYLYSKYKAEVDRIMLDFINQNTDMRVFMVRAPIILGPHTRNVVTTMTEMPVMVGIRGNDPAMQFLHEQDLERLLLWAIQKQPAGVFNVTGTGIIRFSKIARVLGKTALWLPAWLVYPLLGLLWKFHLLSFPPSIMDFVRYPWVASGEKFITTHDFRPEHSSEEAFLAYAKARWPEKSFPD